MIVYDKELKRCPICNGESFYDYSHVGSIINISIHCQDCGLTGHKAFLDSEDDPLAKAIKYWNERVDA